MATAIDCHAQNKPSQDSKAAQYLPGCAYKKHYLMYSLDHCIKEGLTQDKSNFVQE